MRGSAAGGVGVDLRGVVGGFMGCLVDEEVGLSRVLFSFAAMLLLALAAGGVVDMAARPAVLSFFTGSKVKPVEVKPDAVVVNIGEGEGITFGGAELNGFSSSSATRPWTLSLSGVSMLNPAMRLTTVFGVDSCEAGSGCLLGVVLRASPASLRGFEGSSASKVWTCRSGLGFLGAVPRSLLSSTSLRLRLGEVGTFFGVARVVSSEPGVVWLSSVDSGGGVCAGIASSSQS